MGDPYRYAFFCQFYGSRYLAASVAIIPKDGTREHCACAGKNKSISGARNNDLRALSRTGFWYVRTRHPGIYANIMIGTHQRPYPNGVCTLQRPPVLTLTSNSRSNLYARYHEEKSTIWPGLLYEQFPYLDRTHSLIQFFSHGTRLYLCRSLGACTQPCGNTGDHTFCSRQ